MEPNSVMARVYKASASDLEYLKVCALKKENSCDWDEDLLNDIFSAGMLVGLKMFHASRRERRIAGNLVRLHGMESTAVKWQKPSDSSVKCNFNAAVKQDRSRASFGFVVRDALGNFMYAANTTP
ncbi:hypothetical protein LguiB_024602 [Lonicera macranthoides]